MKRATKSTAVTRPLSENEMQLVAASEEREVRAAELPRFDNCKLKIEGLNDNDADAVAWEKVRSLLKIDHIEAAIVAISSAATGMQSNDPDASVNLALQQLSGLQPQNHLETLLIGQMIQVNTAASRCMGLALLEGQTFAGKELNANLAIKFQRTFVAQIEALQKLRGKGGQKVTVEHIHVHEGGQAIVGNVNHSTGGGRGKNEV